MSFPRKRSFLFVLLVIAFMAGIIYLACPATSAHAQAKTFNLKYSGFFPQTDPNETMAVWWCDELQKRTNGRVKIQMFFGESLGKIFDGPKMLRAGIADIGQFAQSTPEFPILGLTDAPYVIPNPSTVTTSVKAFWAMYDKGLLKELSDFKPLWWQAMEPRNVIFAKKRVSTLEELKGMKMRGLPGVQTALLDALGAVGVALPSSDVYTALERGTIEGLITVPAFAINFKIGELSKYWLWEDVGGGGNIMCMTRKTYDSFPADIKKIIDQLNGEAQTRYTKMVQDRVAQNKEALKKAGFEVYYLAPTEHERWRKVAQQVIDKMVTDMEAKGLPAKAAVETMRAVK
jgi:TRAP-type transport system periplasmic protein